MSRTILGQSEVLTLSGVYLFSTGNSTLGIVCGVLGVLGAVCRAAISHSQEQKSDSEKHLDNYEKLSKILTEISDIA